MMKCDPLLQHTDNHAREELQRHLSRKTASCWLYICQPLLIIKLPKINISKFVYLCYWNPQNVTLVSTSNLCPCITKFVGKKKTFVRYDGCLFQNATNEIWL